MTELLQDREVESGDNYFVYCYKCDFVHMKQVNRFKAQMFANAHEEATGHVCDVLKDGRDGSLEELWPIDG